MKILVIYIILYNVAEDKIENNGHLTRARLFLRI